jgi:hypothetical protein
MYKVNGLNEITVDEWIKIFEHFKKVGLERLIKFAGAVDRSAKVTQNLNDIMGQFRNKNSRLEQLDCDFSVTTGFFLEHKLAMIGEGYAMKGKDSLSHFFNQLIREEISFDECIDTLEQLKSRGITHIGKSKRIVTKKISDSVCHCKEGIERYFSDEQIFATKWDNRDFDWFYTIEFDPNCHWRIKSVDKYANDEKERGMDLDTFKLDFNKVPTKADLDDPEFNPLTQSGYQIIKSRV